MFAKTSFFYFICGLALQDFREAVAVMLRLRNCWNLGCGFADVGVALVAICNALRALIVKKNKKNK